MPSIMQRLQQYERWRDDVRNGMTIPRKVIWTLGNVLILIGMILMLFVGGLLADERYNVYAASGDNDVMVPITEAPAAEPAVAGAAPAPTAEQAVPRAPSRFNIPVLNSGSVGELTNAVPAASGDYGPSTITRIVAPAIALDKKVIEVGWTVQELDGQEVAIWDVDKYRVGHHQGTANPGDGGNIVLAGHSGGKAYPFNDIFYLKPGDVIDLYSDNQVYQYQVSAHVLVDEVGQPLEKRIENARFIEPTSEEVVTMVACWPLTGPQKFNQRIIIQAKPANAPAAAADAQSMPSGWTPR